MASRRPPSRVAPGAPAMTSRADPRRILAAGIVVGDDHPVGEPRRRPRPFPAFALVAIATGAEDVIRRLLTCGRSASIAALDRVRVCA